jgi:hypothetical protein
MILSWLSRSFASGWEKPSVPEVFAREGSNVPRWTFPRAPFRSCETLARVSASKAMNRHDRRAAAAKDPRLQGAEIRYGGRTLELRVYVNTDEPYERVFERVQRAVKSAPNSPMVMMTVAELDDAEADALWQATIRAMREQSERDGGGPS